MRNRNRDGFTGLLIKIGIMLMVVFITTVVTWQVAIKTFSGDQYLLSKEQFARFSKYQKLDEIVGNIKKNYYQDIDENKLIESGYEGIVAGIGDPYSEYLTKEEIEENNKFNSGTFFGVGIVFNISKEESYPIVRNVYTDSPADKAGVEIDDYIIEVEGISTVGMSSEKLVAMITGEKNTDVKIKVLRARQEQEFTMTRAEIQSEVISSAVMDGNVGYVRLFTFSGKSSERLITEFKSLESKGCTSFILDLRNNGGGLLDQATQIADFFMPGGRIVYIQGKDGVEQSFDSDAKAFKKPVVILVNENTASASEIVCGAMKNSAVAKLVGEKTFGKGVVQSFYPLTDGNSSLKLTSAVYYLANGETPHGKGITPDYEIEMDQKNIGIVENDIQLQKALEISKQ